MSASRNRPPLSVAGTSQVTTTAITTTASAELDVPGKGYCEFVVTGGTKGDLGGYILFGKAGEVETPTAANGWPLYIGEPAQFSCLDDSPKFRVVGTASLNLKSRRAE